MSLVNDVRTTVEKFVAIEQFDERDIETFRKLDSYVTRFLESSDFNANKAAEAIVASLRWRTVHKANDISVQDIPRELVDCGQTWYGMDIDGGHYNLSRIGLHRRHHGVSDLSVTFYSFVNDCLLRDFGQDFKCDVYYDLRGSSYRTLDREMSKKMTELMDVNYVGLVKKVYIYGMSPLIKSALDVILRVLPKRCTQKVDFLTLEDAEARMVTKTPVFDNENLSTIDEIGQRKGWTREQIAALKEYYAKVSEKCIAEKEINAN